MSFAQGSPEALARFERAAEDLADLPVGDALVDSLRVRAIMMRSMGQPSMEEFVLRYGKRFTPEPLGDLAPGDPQQCYTNALRAVVTSGDPDLRYVEGFACRPDISFPIHHAWVTRADETVAIDPTWDSPLDCLYWGIAFETTYVLDICDETGVTGRTLEIHLRRRLAAEA